MDEQTLLTYINTVSGYGDADLSKRFTALIKDLYNDPKVSKMPDENKEALFEKIFNRYKQGAEETGLAKASGALEEAGGGRVSNSSGDGGSPMQGSFQGTQADTDRSFGALGEAAKDKALSTVGGSLAATAIGGVDFGDALKGAINPSTLISGGIGAIGGAMTEGMGFGVDQGFVEKLGVSGLSMALSMVNPVLGIAASVLGKPVADLVMDAGNWRDFESVRDQLEDSLGSISGRQAYADAYDGINKAFNGDYTQFENSDKAYGKLSDVTSALQTEYNNEAKKTQPNVDALNRISEKLKSLEPLQESLTASTGKSAYQTAVDSARERTQDAISSQTAKTLGISRSEYDTKMAEAERLGIKGQITGTTLADAQKAEQAQIAEAEAVAAAKAKAVQQANDNASSSQGFNSSGNWSWGGSSGYSSRDTSSNSGSGNSGSSNSSGGSQNNSAGDQSSSDGVGGR